MAVVVPCGGATRDGHFCVVGIMFVTPLGSLVRSFSYPVLMENREIGRTHRLSMTGALMHCLVGGAAPSAGVAGRSSER